MTRLRCWFSSCVCCSSRCSWHGRNASRPDVLQVRGDAGRDFSVLGLILDAYFGPSLRVGGWLPVPLWNDAVAAAVLAIVGGRLALCRNPQFSGFGLRVAAGHAGGALSRFMLCPGPGPGTGMEDCCRLAWILRRARLCHDAGDSTDRWCFGALSALCGVPWIGLVP